MRELFKSAAGILLACLLTQTVYAAEDKSGLVLSFDDTYIDQWYDYFGSRVDNKEVKATFFVSHWHTLTKAQLDKLRVLQEKGHEIGHHTYSHKGVAGDYNFDPSRIREYLDEQIIPPLLSMRAEGFDPVSFSYPSGERNAVYDAAIRPYLPYLRTTFASDAFELFQMDDIFHGEADSYAYLAGDGIDNAYANPIAEIEAALLRAKTNNEVVTLYAHRILQDGATNEDYGYGIRVSKLDQVIATAKQMGLKFYTFAEAYQLGTHSEPDLSQKINIGIEGTRANIRWKDLAPHDLIGIVPVGQSDWTTDMPGATTNGSADGKMGITIPAQAMNQQYVAIFYLGAVKVETSQPFTIVGSGDTGGGDTGGGDTGGGDTGGGDTGGGDTGGGDTGGGDTGGGTVDTYVEGSRVRVSWSGLSVHDFIGVVPANQGDWQQGMPGADVSSSTSGKIGITASDAIPGQQYIVIFYNGTIRVATSQPFIIIAGSGGGDTGGGDTGGGDTGGGDTGGGDTGGGDTGGGDTGGGDTGGGDTGGGDTGGGDTGGGDTGGGDTGGGDTGGGDTGGGDTGGGDTGGGDTGSVAAHVEGQRVRIAWNDLPATHTYIGISPLGQDWQSGMPYAETGGEVKGKMGITVHDAVPGQQYVVTFYTALNGIVISSEPLIISP